MAKINETFEPIEKIAKLMNENGLTELRVETNEIKIYMSSKHAQNIPNAYDPAFLPPPPQYRQQTEIPVQGVNAVVAEVSGNVIKSPIIGTFYAAPAPDKPVFVSAGDRVECGQVICIIESMKLMNEITSDFAGVVKEIYINDGDSVEFDQKIMRIE